MSPAKPKPARFQIKQGSPLSLAAWPARKKFQVEPGTPLAEHPYPGNVKGTHFSTNSKYGGMGKKFRIIGFDLPALRTIRDVNPSTGLVTAGFLICPGAKLCKNGCYARGGMYVSPGSVWRCHYNFQTSLEPWFEDVMVSDIEHRVHSSRVPIVVRIHTSGEFYNRDYLMKWIRICERLPKTDFWCYTKMFPLVEPLRESNAIPSNLEIVYSEGSRWDDQIRDGVGWANRKHSRIFGKKAHMKAAGYKDAMSDKWGDLRAVLPKLFGDPPSNDIGLYWHGTLRKFVTDPNHADYPKLVAEANERERIIRERMVATQSAMRNYDPEKVYDWTVTLMVAKTGGGQEEKAFAVTGKPPEAARLAYRAAREQGYTPLSLKTQFPAAVHGSIHDKPGVGPLTNDPASTADWKFYRKGLTVHVHANGHGSYGIELWDGHRQLDHDDTPREKNSAIFHARKLLERYLRTNVEENPSGKLTTDQRLKRHLPIEVWQTQAGDWTWEVYRKYQKPELEDRNPFARWFCLVKSPFVPEGELGDVYVRDIKKSAQPVVPDPTRSAPSGSYKTEVLTGEAEWVANALRFRTEIEAGHYGNDLMSRWMAAKEVRVVKSPDTPTHRFIDGVLEELKANPATSEVHPGAVPLTEPDER